MFTVFDTNIYRGLSAERLATLQSFEAQQGVVALSAFWPVLELLAGISDQDVQEAKSGWSALKRLVEHTVRLEDGVHRAQVMENGDEQLARGLFKKSLPQRNLNHREIAVFIIGITKVGWDSLYPWQREVLEQVVLHVRDREARFAAMMEEMGRTVDVAAQGIAGGPSEARKQLLELAKRKETLRLIASSRVVSLARELGLAAAQYDVEALTDQLLQAFPVPIILTQQLILQALASEVNWTANRRKNSVWDRDLAFHISRTATVDNLPVLLVTDDRDIRNAAELGGYGDFVETLEGYFRLLQEGAVTQRVKDMLALVEDQLP
jgi:hypothetical protein